VQVFLSEGLPPTNPVQIKLGVESYTNFITLQTLLVLSGAFVDITTVPARAPNEVLFTGILKVVVLMIVAVVVMFTAVQLPVPPESVTVGRDDRSKPWPPEMVITAGFAFVAEDTVIRDVDGCTLRAWQTYIRLVPL